jgi:SAM-dependent methyltransferase
VNEGNVRHPDSIYATPRVVTELEDCNFYHVMDIPGYGCARGKWDLREAAHEYLGRVDLEGKRVLEVGTASGFLCFYMEQQGAQVVAYDLSPDQTWDILPLPRHECEEYVLERKSATRRLNNAFWLCHRAYDSRAKVVYGSAYDIPEEIGMVDISVYSAILLHLQDPFLALQKGLRLTRETVIITEDLWNRFALPLMLLTSIPAKLGVSLPLTMFASDLKPRKSDTWWHLAPEAVKAFIGVLGFEKAEVKYHFKAKRNGRRRLLYTVVGHRTDDRGLVD